MKCLRLWMLVLLGAGGLLHAPGARAQWAVVDVRAIGQLVQEVQTLQQVLQNARGQLVQAQQQFQSLTGPRGMQDLLSGTVRNYLPSSQSDLDAALAGAGGYPAFGAAMQAAVQAAAVLNADQLAGLAPDASADVLEARSTAALLQGLAGSALANASGRFASLQQLIDALATTRDPKATLDLQARIAAEQGMLQNERTKLQSLYEAARARSWADAERNRERVIAAHGSFASRFEPVP